MRVDGSSDASLHHFRAAHLHDEASVGERGWLIPPQVPGELAFAERMLADGAVRHACGSKHRNVDRGDINTGKSLSGTNKKDLNSTLLNLFGDSID